MKHYTTIEQSTYLLSLGLDKNTADMWYDFANHIRVDNRDKNYNWSWIPCWSLGALLELMPDGTSIFYKYNYTIIDMVDVIGGIVRNKHREKGSTPIEAAYSMICWLLENNHLKTESPLTPPVNK